MILLPNQHNYSFIYLFTCKSMWLESLISVSHTGRRKRLEIERLLQLSEGSPKEIGRLTDELYIMSFYFFFCLNRFIIKWQHGTLFDGQIEQPS